MAFQSINSPQISWPSGADSIAVTPNASAGANSAYAELSASVSAASLISGIALRPNLSNFVWYEVDLATGSGGAETPIGTFRGAMFANGPEMSNSQLPILVDNIANAARLSWRLRKAGTDTTQWRCAALGYSKPISGSVLTTTNFLKCEPNGSASVNTTSGGGAWTSGSYSQIIASTAAAWLLIAVIPYDSTAWEVDIAVGAAASENVICTLRGIEGNNWGGVNYMVLTSPISQIPISSRISARSRANGAGATVPVALNYFELPLS